MLFKLCSWETLESIGHHGGVCRGGVVGPGV